jgi:hypothetical protein
MSRSTLRRLESLEQKVPHHGGKWHQVTIEQGEDADARMAAMTASGEAKEGDNFILRIIVDPPTREPTL